MLRIKYTIEAFYVPMETVSVITKVFVGRNKEDCKSQMLAYLNNLSKVGFKLIDYRAEEG